MRGIAAAQQSRRQVSRRHHVASGQFATGHGAQVVVSGALLAQNRGRRAVYHLPKDQRLVWRAGGVADIVWLFVEGIICHQRISYDSATRVYSLIIKYKSKEKKDKVLQGKPDGSLEDFIRVAKAKLHLEKSCKVGGVPARVGGVDESVRVRIGLRVVGALCHGTSGRRISVNRNKFFLAIF